MPIIRICSFFSYTYMGLTCGNNLKNMVLIFYAMIFQKNKKNHFPYYVKYT